MYEHFPQPWDDTEAHQRYVHGCFRLARSCPGLKERIVALVVDHIIVLDVRARDRAQRAVMKDAKHVCCRWT